MDADEFARDVLQAAQDGGRDFELPQPTFQDVLDYIESANPGYELPDTEGLIARRQRDHGYVEPYILHNQARYARMIRFAAKARALGFIDTATHDRLVSAERIDGQRQHELRDKVRYWRPMPLGNQQHPNGGIVTCFTLRMPDDTTIDLTFEGGRWIRHDGYPYALRKS